MREMKDVFKRYLTRGKPGYVPHPWASALRSRRLDPRRRRPGGHRASGPLQDRRPRACDGCSPSFAISAAMRSKCFRRRTRPRSREFATLARAFGLQASCGSDWHGPDESWMDFGDAAPDVDPRRPGLEGLVAVTSCARPSVPANAPHTRHAKVTAPSSSSPTARASRRKCSATACCRSSRTSSSSGCTIPFVDSAEKISRRCTR